MITDDEFQELVSQEFSLQQWKLLKEFLLGPNVTNFHWVEIWDSYYRARIENRYLLPIEHITQNDTYKGEGFAIAAILCCLLEMLESFEQGKEYRPGVRSGQLQAHEYSSSGRMFKDFLLNRSPFKEELSGDESLADDLYTSIRCGLLHEARTKGGWKVRADEPDSSIFDFKNKILYRTNLVAAVIEYLEAYKYRLVGSRELQEKFVRRVDSLLM